jgi:hypothetical protein
MTEQYLRWEGCIFEMEVVPDVISTRSGFVTHSLQVNNFGNFMSEREKKGTV